MRVLDDWLLTAERVAVHLPTETAVLADLHLGYAQARRRSGEAVPNDSLDEQLSSLRRLCRQHAVRRLVIAGDLLEDGRCTGVFTAFRDWLSRNAIQLAALVPGNHDLADCGLSANPQSGGAFRVGAWQVVHGDGPLPEGPVVHGHEHPCLRWTPRSRVIRPRLLGGLRSPAVLDGPCYLVGSRRLILPAFSTDAVGVNVLPVRRWRTYRCCVIAGDRVLDFGDLATLRSRLETIE
jgi:metallophosphoesterase superfamily enzyme